MAKPKPISKPSSQRLTIAVTDRLTTAVADHREILQSYIKNKTYLNSSYEHWMGKWFSEGEKLQESKQKIKTYTESNFISRWWQRQTTDIAVRIKLKPIWEAWDYSGPIKGLADKLNVVQSSSSWFSTLRWRLNAMNTPTTFSSIFKELGNRIVNCFTRKNLEKVELDVRPAIPIKLDAVALPKKAVVQEQKVVVGGDAPLDHLQAQFLADIKGKPIVASADVKLDVSTAMVIVTPDPKPSSTSAIEKSSGAEKSVDAKERFLITEDIRADAELLGLKGTDFSRGELRAVFLKKIRVKHPNRPSKDISEEETKALLPAYRALIEKTTAKFDNAEIEELCKDYPFLNSVAKLLEQRHAENLENVRAMHAQHLAESTEQMKKFSAELEAKNSARYAEYNKDFQRLGQQYKTESEETAKSTEASKSINTRFNKLHEQMTANALEPDLEKRAAVKQVLHLQYMEIKKQIQTSLEIREKANAPSVAPVSVNYFANQMMLKGQSAAAPAPQTCAAEVTRLDEVLLPQPAVH